MEEGGSSKRPLERSQSTQSSKKKKIDGLKALPGNTSPPEVIIKKNLELAVQVKRLRTRLRLANEKVDSQKKATDAANSLISTVHRSWDFFLKQVVELLQDASISTDIKLDDKSEVANVIDSFLDKSIYEGLLKQITGEVPEVSEEDKDDEPLTIEEQLPKVETHVEERVNKMIEILKSIINNIVSKGDKFRDQATKNLFINNEQTLNLKKKLSQIEDRSKLYVGRIQELEKQVLKYRAEAEDAVAKRDVSLRRLAKVCVKALDTNEVEKMVESMKEEGSFPSDMSGNLPPATSQAATDTTIITTDTGGSTNEEYQAVADIAAKRLIELKESMDKQNKLLEEVQALKSSLAVANSRIQQLENKSNRVSDSDVDYQNEQKIKEIVETGSAARLLFEKLEDSLKQNDLDLERRVNKIVDEHKVALAERDAGIAKVAMELAETKNRLKQLDKLQNSLDECNKSLEIKQSEIDLLKSQNSRLEKGLVVDELKKKLQDALDGKFPDNKDIRDRVMLQVELDSALKQIESLNSSNGSEELLAEMTDMQQVLSDTEQQNQRLISTIKKMESDIENVNQKVLTSYDQNQKLKQKFQTVETHYRKEKDTRILNDRQYSELNELNAKLMVENAHCTRAFQNMQTQELLINKKLSEMEKSKEELFEKLGIAENTLKSRSSDFVELEKTRNEIEHEMKRLEEERKNLKRLAKSSTKSSSTGGADEDIQLKLEVYENALRCPVSRQYWKDAIISTCCHMFARKTLEDNMKNRNRKCPTCKKMFDKSDIKSVFLVDENDYGE